jgi:hypothetical protein
MAASQRLLGEAVEEAMLRSRVGAVKMLEDAEQGLWLQPWLVVAISVVVVVAAFGVGWWYGGRSGGVG